MTPACSDFIRRLGKVIIAGRSLLKALPTTTCAICTDDFIYQDELLRLPNCHHLFHRKCILTWFSRNNTCPLCRRVYPPEQPKRHVVLIRSSLALYHGQSFNDPTLVSHLHFHLRPLNSDSRRWSSQPTGLLQEMLVAEGYHDLATRACGPFWVNVDRIQQSVDNSS